MSEYSANEATLDGPSRVRPSRPCLIWSSTVLKEEVERTAMSHLCGFACLSTAFICLYAIGPQANRSESEAVAIQCDKSGLVINVSTSALKEADEVDVLVQSVPAEKLLMSSTRRVYRNSVKSIGYKLKLEDLLEDVSSTDKYIRVTVLAGRSSNPEWGVEFVEERVFRVRDLRNWRNKK